MRAFYQLKKDIFLANERILPNKESTSWQMIVLYLQMKVFTKRFEHVTFKGEHFTTKERI